jgi:hypothetical protein
VDGGSQRQGLDQLSFSGEQRDSALAHTVSWKVQSGEAKEERVVACFRSR